MKNYHVPLLQLAASRNSALSDVYAFKHDKKQTWEEAGSWHTTHKPVWYFKARTIHISVDTDTKEIQLGDFRCAGCLKERTAKKPVKKGRVTEEGKSKKRKEKKRRAAEKTSKEKK